MSQRLHEIRRIESALKGKQPHRAFRLITFDRTQIRSEISLYTFDEACRKKGPIYEMFPNELYRAGCKLVPHMFFCLTVKEKELYDEYIINDRITDDHAFLFPIFDKLKQAELFLMPNKLMPKESFTLLYEVICDFQPHRLRYEYAFVMIIDFIVSLCHECQGKFVEIGEMIARIYYAYAMFLKYRMKQDSTITYLEHCLNLAKGHIWREDQGDCTSLLLHELASRSLATELILKGRAIVREQPTEAIQLAHKAILTIAEIGLAKHLDLAFDTSLNRAFFLMEDNKYKEAYQTLELVQVHVASCTHIKFIKLIINFYYYMGQCLEQLREIDRAISNFKSALSLANQYNHKIDEAEILLSLGKLYAKDIEKTSLAKKCYQQAEQIFISFNKMYEKKKVNFLMAKLLADAITPHYMAMLKASTTRYCAFFNLRQWKNRCRPFWIELGAELKKQKKDNLYCLLNEEQPDKIRESIKHVDSKIDYNDI